MSKAAIVFGGAGFIGSHLLLSLAESGHYNQLVSCDIGAPRIVVPGVDYKQIDVRLPIPADACAAGAEIYNFAAVHTTPGHEDWEYYWTNVLGAVHVCDFARRTNATNIVFTSSIAVYGATEEEKREDSRLEPGSAYGCSKLCAEKIHTLWQAESPADRRLVIVRPAVIYGLGERGNFTRLAQLLQRGRFVYPGRRDTVKSCGYVKDLVRSMQFVSGLNRGVETYNFCHRARYTTADICAGFSRVAGYRKPRVLIPLPPMLFAGWLFEALTRIGLKTSINRARIRKLVSSTNIAPQRLAEAGFQYSFDLDRSLADWREASGNREFL